MSHIKPATQQDLGHVVQAVDHMMAARAYLKEAGCLKALAAVTKALKSADATERHLRRRLARTEGT